jgi:predicted Zn-dependent protease
MTASPAHESTGPGVVDEALVAEVSRLRAGPNITMRRQIHRLYLLTDQYIAAGRPADAIPLLRSALTVDAGNLDAHITLAELLNDQGARDEALDVASRVSSVVESDALFARLAKIDPSITETDQATNAWNAYEADLSGPRVVLVPVGDLPSMVLKEFGRQLNQHLKIPVRIQHLDVSLGAPERDPGAPWLASYYRNLLYTMSLEQQALLGLDFEPTPATQPTRDQMIDLVHHTYRLRGTSAERDHRKFTQAITRHDARVQYDAHRLIQDVKGVYTAPPNELVLIVSSGDIFVDRFNFVFCSPEPPYACMSPARYFGSYSGEPEHRPRLIKRMMKAAMWGVFANASLPVCSTPFCMRSYAHSLDEEDRHADHLCETCQAQWKQYSGYEPDP